MNTTDTTAIPSRTLEQLRDHLRRTGKTDHQIGLISGVGHTVARNFLTLGKNISVTSLEKLVNSFGLEVEIKPRLAGSATAGRGA